MIASKKNFVELLGGIFRSPYFTQDLLLLEDHSRNTLLQVACLAGSVESVQYILKSDYMLKDLLDHQNRLKNNALILTVYCDSEVKSLQILQHLLRSEYLDEDLFLQKNVKGLTVLSFFCKHKRFDFVEMIINSPHCSRKLLSSYSDEGNTALGYALEDINTLQSLLDGKRFFQECLFDIQERTKPMMAFAAFKHCFDAMRVILTRYPELSRQLLHQRGERGVNAFEALLVYDPSTKERSWIKDKIFTEQNLNSEILAHPCDIESRGISNSNLLLLAYHNKDRPLLKKILMMQHCTSQVLNIRDSAGMSLAMYATDREDLEVWRWILNSPGYSRSVLVQRDSNEESLCFSFNTKGTLSEY